MTSTANIPKFTPAQAKLFQQRRELSEEMSRLSKRSEALKKDREAIDARLAEVYGDDELRRFGKILVQRTIVTVPETIVTSDMVGNVLRKGFSYPKFTEIEG